MSLPLCLHLPLDTPLEPEDFPAPSTVEAARSRTEVILDLVRREKPTLRPLLARLAGARGHHTFAGTPEQVADLMADWFTSGAADGFNIMPRAAGAAGGLYCRRNPVASTSRAFSHGVRGGNAASALWFGGTGKSVRLGLLQGHAVLGYRRCIILGTRASRPLQKRPEWPRFQGNPASYRDWKTA